MPSNLPDYIASAKPVPLSQRQPWYKNTAPTYAGIMLWFVFWDEIVASAKTADGMAVLPGGSLAAGLGVAILGIVIAAFICHALFYLVPAMLGMTTGLPLYIVGTSTYGAKGGFIMPGFIMGVLQFGWLGVNAFFSSQVLYNAFASTQLGPQTEYPVAGHAVIAGLWAIVAAVLGLKGIQYVAKVATFLPLIPLVILLFLVAKTIGGVGSFDAAAFTAKQKVVGGPEPLGAVAIIALMSTYIVGFFATAGAAGADFGMNNPDRRNVQLGGLVGIGLATIFTACASVLIVAGVHGSPSLAAQGSSLQPTGLLGTIFGTDSDMPKVLLTLLAVAAFPPACFSSFIAANSFKTTLPKINPVVSVGIGTAVSILLAVTGWAGNAINVFKVIGASFGPICGAMTADYLLAGGRWAGPRAGFNPAGWISWAVGFAIGVVDFFGWVSVPAAPVMAYIFGFAVYAALAKAGLQSQKLEMPPPAP